MYTIYTIFIKDSIRSLRESTNWMNTGYRVKNHGGVYGLAIYHLSARLIKRTQGKSAVGGAAYRAGDYFYSERADKHFDYRGKSVSHSEILTPEHVGEWAKDRETLWQTVEQSERQWSNGQLARDLEIALPRELSLDENADMLRDFVQQNFVDKGMIADINIHEEKASDGEMNPHAHIMLTMKEVDAESDQFKSAKNRDWNKKALLKEWRENWADTVNDTFEEKGIVEQIDHRTLAAQGIEREPEIHVGQQSNDIAQKGGYAERFERNEAIKERNYFAEMASKAKEYINEKFDKALAWVRREESNMSSFEREEMQSGYAMNQPKPPQFEIEEDKNKGFDFG